LKTPLRVLLSLAVATVFLAALMAWGGVSVAELVAAWRRGSWSAIALAFVVYAAQYALRAARFRVLVPPEQRASFACTLSVTAAYGMATVILPAKVGEATFVVYLNRAGGVGGACALAALVVARLLDVATLLAGFGVACVALWISGTHGELGWLAPLGPALVAGSALAFALSARGDLLVRWATLVTRALGLARRPRGARLVERLAGLEGALREAASGGRVLRAAALSLPMWACVFVFCAVLARGFGLPETVSFAEATFGASLAILTSLVPLSAFASFGTLEAGWVLGFGAFGVSRELALATGTGLHLAQLAYAIVLGVLGHVGMAVFARERGATRVERAT
jgi:glycosyltransferase 2 family protein